MGLGSPLQYGLLSRLVAVQGTTSFGDDVSVQGVRRYCWTLFNNTSGTLHLQGACL